jgi:hypothetical protein
MTRLVDALVRLGLSADVELGGKWVTLRGDRATIYVVAGAWGSEFYTWCDIPEARAIERYPDAVSAIQAGLRRSSALRSPDSAPMSDDAAR